MHVFHWTSESVESQKQDKINNLTQAVRAFLSSIDVTCILADLENATINQLHLHDQAEPPHFL